MSLAISQHARRLVAGQFDARTFERALAYAREGRVHLVKPPPWPVVARVQGSNGYVVTLDYNTANRYFSGDCSCPVGVDCKHAAATALIVLSKQRELAVDRANAERDEAVGEWLSSFGHERESQSQAGSRNIVAYVLGRGSEGSVSLIVMRSTRLKRGGYSRGTVMSNLGDGYHPVPGWVSDDDLRRIAIVRALARANPYDRHVTLGRIDAALLEDLAASGHLFWEEIGTPPLRYGPTVRTQLSWRPHEGEDEFKLGLDGELVLVPARDPHYIDVAAAVLGPLETGVEPSVLQRLVDSPPVPVRMLGTVQRNLGALLAAAAAPKLPAGVAKVEAAEPPEPMRPRLALRVGDDEFFEQAVLLEPEAVYGDRVFALGVWDAQRPFARDLINEGRRARELERFVDAVPPRRDASASATDVLDDARYYAHEVVPALRASGWDCTLDADFPVEAPQSDLEWVSALEPMSESGGWFGLELGVIVAGRKVPLLPILLKAIRSGELRVGAELEDGEHPGINLRLPDGDMIHVPGQRLRDWLRPLIELSLTGLRRDGELIVPASTAIELAEAEPGRYGDSAALAELRERFAGLVDLPPRTEPEGFAGTLRPYQRAGLAWLRYLHDAGLGGLLADDMGLGKTVQVLAFLEELRLEGRVSAAAPVLVVAPRSVVGNWCDEANRFAPGLEPLIHLGPGRNKTPAALATAPLIVTSYQTLLRDIDLLRELPWTTVLFDEAQAIKNPATKLRRAAASIPAGSRFCITGTPIENHLGELWSQIDLVMPGLLGRPRTFDAVFRKPIEKHGEPRPLDLLRRRVRPFLLRRTKATVDLDLPPKTVVVERVDLDSKQRDLYESLRLSLDADVRRSLAARGIKGSSLVILDALLKLRQSCCDPRLVKIEGAGEVRGSAKLDRLIGMLEELADSGRATLVFSQFTTMIDLIEAELRRAGIPFVTLTGSTRDREAVVRRFQAGEVPVFLISLKAGGVGLNLTRADTVIHYDPWWNPAAEDQATDRAHRIGQDKNLIVYKLVARGTLEERICQMQDEKRKLTDATLRGGGHSHLGAEDLRALIQEIV